MLKFMSDNLLKQLRDEMGLTQEAVAIKLGVTPNTVQNWERLFKFKRPEDLHALLDVYGVSDATRNLVVMDVYGRKSEGDVAMPEKNPECVVLKQAVDRLVDEKDVQYVPYPLDKVCTCLDVIEIRIKCLGTAIQYVETYFFSKKGVVIAGWETAITIDAVGGEYSVEIGAAEVYQIQENNSKVSAIFPFGDDEDWMIHSEEFGREMDCEEYMDALSSKVELRRSSLEELKVALGLMKRDFLELRIIRERILAYMCQQSCWEKSVEVSGLIDVNDEMFWEVLTIQRTGRSYRKGSTLKRMEWFLDRKKDSISIDRRPKMKKRSRMDIYCESGFQSRETVAQVLSVMGRALDAVPVICDVSEAVNWEDMCLQSTLLKEYLVQYKQTE